MSKRTQQQQGAGHPIPPKQQQQEQPQRAPERDALTQRAPGTSAEPKPPKQMGEGDREEQVKQHAAANPDANPTGEFGEGNYAASRDYHQRTKAFIESGRVDEAAQDAHPRDEVEAEDMAEAERQGKSRAREEDPSVNQAPKPGRGPDE